MRGQFTKDGGIDIEKALAYWVHRVQSAARTTMFREFRRAGEDITPEQWMVLVRLWERDGRTQTELGQATFQDRPTMSRILAGMETRGWLTKRADPESARIWRVHLTALGRSLKSKLVPAAERLVTDMQRGIAEKDLELTRRTLERLFANLVE